MGDYLPVEERVNAGRLKSRGSEKPTGIKMQLKVHTVYRPYHRAKSLSQIDLFQHTCLDYIPQWIKGLWGEKGIRRYSLLSAEWHESESV